jgi:hypothetical protein
MSTATKVYTRLKKDCVYDKDFYRPHSPRLTQKCICTVRHLYKDYQHGGLLLRSTCVGFRVIFLMSTAESIFPLFSPFFYTLHQRMLKGLRYFEVYTIL